MAPYPPRGRVKRPRPRGQKKLQKLEVAQCTIAIMGTKQLRRSGDCL